MSIQMQKPASRSALLALVATTILSGCSIFDDKQGSLRDEPSKSAAELSVETYVGSEPGFLVTSHLILGPTEAFLVDGQFTRSDAKQVVAMIQKSGRRLKTVFVTHGHPDHYFGIETLRQAFPETRFVASEETVADIKATGSGKLAYWKTMYGAELPDAVPQVDVVSDRDLSVDGERIQVKQIGPGESEHASILYVASLKAAFTGDMVYDRVHLWLADAVGQTDSWKENLANLKADESVQALYVGHQKTKRVSGKQLIDINVNYINEALAVFSKSATAEQAATALKQAHSDFGLPVIADIAAGAFVAAKAKK